MSKITDFIANSRRVLRLTKKPQKDEFITIAKITALGMLLIGFIGYIIETVRYVLNLS